MFRVYHSRLLRTLTILSLICVMLVGLVPMPARAAAGLDFAEIDKFISNLMDMYKMPGVGVALVKNDRIIYARGHGYANIATSEPATEFTSFAIGSVTKSFTSLAIAQLVDEGLLDLDSPVIEYIPEFKLKDAEATKTLTVRQVLSHASGLPRADDLWGEQFPESRKQIIEDMAKIEPTAKPGELWQYNNQNFTLAGYIVERVTGQTWESYTRQNILEPLGITSATFSVRAMVKQPDHSLPYTFRVRTGPEAMSFESSSYRGVVALGPAGSIGANVLDMARYVRFQLGDGTFNGQRIVSKRMLDEMHRTQMKITEEAQAQEVITSLASNQAYGLGWLTETYQGYQVVQHGGNIDGFSASVSLVPSEGVGVVILTNYNTEGLFIESARLGLINRLLGLNVPDPTEQINVAAGFFPKARWDQVLAARSYKADPKELERYLLKFESPFGNVEIVLKEGRLYADLDTFIAELLPFEPDKFLVELGSYSSLGIVEFTQNALGTEVTLNGAQIAFIPSANTASGGTYEDPQDRFTVTLPPRFAVEKDVVPTTYISEDKAVRLRFDAAKATSENAADNAQNWLATFREGFNAKPLAVTPLPAIEGVTWTQVAYVMPDGLVIAVITTVKDGTAYFIGIEGQQGPLAAMQAQLITLITSFKING